MDINTPESELTYISQELNEQDEADYDINLEKGADGNWRMTLQVRQAYLVSQGYTAEEANEILNYLENLFAEFDVDFCDEPSPDCVPEALKFLQVVNVNMRHLGTRGTSHPSMWDDNAREQNIHHLLNGYHWHPIAAGAVDGVSEEVTSIPLFAITIIDVINDKEKQEAFLKMLSAEGVEKLVGVIIDDLEETFEEEDKTQYVVTKGSVQVVLAFYVLLGQAVKGVANYLDKVGDLTRKMESSPGLLSYLRKVVNDNNAVGAQKLDGLLETMNPADLERLIARVPEERMDDFIADLSDNSILAQKFIESEELVDAWNSFKNAGLDDLARNTDNLDALNKALKQDGYDAAYFENLLKSKSDPQKFIDDYVSKIGDNGKFVDDALESDYASYLTRKTREGKPPRDRADWNHTRDYMLNDSPLARGNNFNRKAWENEWYPAWEVQLDNGKFIDGYNPFTKEIVSRKATDLVDVSESTFRSYLDELVRKYAPPKKITTKKQGAIYDQLRANPDLPLDSKLILEIPESNRTFYDIDRYTQIASEKGITIKFAPE